jgi:Inner membrane component of T3SS, cytoplasmic domain/Inner membrane component of T3SS, periplasmic domain
MFEVISGLHVGVIIPLEMRRYTIGSTLPADIILHDTGVAPEHAALLIDRQRVRLEALGGDVAMQTGRLPAAHGCYLQLPIDIVLGEATIRVRLPGGPQPPDGWTIETLLRAASRRMWTRTGIGIVSALALCLAGAALTFSTSVTKADADGMAPTSLAALGDPGREKMENEKHSEPPRIDDVVRDLAGRLDAAGLHALKAAVAGDRLTVTGDLDKRDSETWTAVQRWFDQTYGRQIILGAHVNIGEAKTAPPLSLQAVWYGANPYVIATDGAHYYEGTVLQSGWVVREIDANRVMLVRNGESVALAYR